MPQLTAQDVVPKKCNTIIISDTLNQLQYYNAISDILFESGYGILTGDKEQGTISTTEKSFKDGVVKLNILMKDKKVVLRGDFKSDISITIGGVSTVPNWNTIEYTGGKGSPYRNAWNELLKISDQIPGRKTYTIK